MEKIATDIYTFEKLRVNGFTYVDKTDRILPLADLSRGSQFFLARPRRFGKSLLVSTLKSLFLGKRDLFKGLAIEPQWDWSKTCPVIHLDMGSTQADKDRKKKIAPLRNKPVFSGGFRTSANADGVAPDPNAVTTKREYESLEQRTLRPCCSFPCSSSAIRTEIHGLVEKLLSTR